MSEIARPERVVWGVFGVVMLVGVSLLFCGCRPASSAGCVPDCLAYLDWQMERHVSVQELRERTSICEKNCAEETPCLPEAMP